LNVDELFFVDWDKLGFRQKMIVVIMKSMDNFNFEPVLVSLIYRWLLLM